MLLVVCSVTAPVLAMWTDDMEQALKTAKAENRYLLVNFTGSDWCGWCIKLDKEVFSKSEFKKYAQEKLVPVMIDFPMRKKLSSRLQKQNSELQTKFGVRGYPTILILDPSGAKIAQTGYQPGGAEAYIQHIEKLIAPHAEKFGEVKKVVEAPGPVDVNVMRVWTSSQGNTLEASYSQRIGDNIELRRSDGSQVRIDLSSLSESDLEFLRSIKAIK